MNKYLTPRSYQRRSAFDQVSFTNLIGAKCIFLSAVLVGCASTPKLPPPKEGPTFFVHRLGQGETLGQLSNWYTGIQGGWKEFFVRASDSDKNRLPVGGVVLIPEHLLVRRDPPPRTFFKSIQKKSSSTIPAKEESIVDSPVEEPIEPPLEQQVVDNTDVGASQKEMIEDEFLGQIIESTKMHELEDLPVQNSE